jgi:hypothetical protein
VIRFRTIQRSPGEDRNCLFRTSEFLKFIAVMMGSPVDRIVVAGCAALDQGIIGDGKQPLNLEASRGDVSSLRRVDAGLTGSVTGSGYRRIGTGRAVRPL